MKYLVLYLLAILLSVGTVMYSPKTLAVYYSTMQEENETGQHGTDKQPVTDKLTVYLHKHLHFSDEFSEKQYFILHDHLHNDGYTSRVELPPEM